MDERCAYCGEVAIALVRDHVIPIALGGWDVSENVVASCGTCNSRKAAKVWIPRGWSKEKLELLRGIAFCDPPKILPPDVADPVRWMLDADYRAAIQKKIMMEAFPAFVEMARKDLRVQISLKTFGRSLVAKTVAQDSRMEGLEEIADELGFAHGFAH